LVGRDRWVELAKKKVIWDGSDVPAEWHMWLHHMRDEPPTTDEIEGTGRAVKSVHTPNYTGDNSKRYYPPGHFFNPQHENPNNSQRIRPFDLKKPLTEI
jgi:NADH:ubiquinone oxidoreductase subunit